MNLIHYGYRALNNWLNCPAMKRLAQKLLPYRQAVIVGIHLFLFTFSYFSAFWAIIGLTDPGDFVISIPQTLIPLVCIRAVVFFHYDLYQGMWRYVAFEDLVNIVRAATISTIMYILAGTWWEQIALSNRFYLVEWMICIFFTGGIRFIVRNIRENFIYPASEKRRENVVLVGYMNRIQPIVKELVSDKESRYNPLAIVDVEKKGRFGTSRLNDIPVLGLEAFLEKKRFHRKIKICVMCWPDSERGRLNAMIEKLEPLRASFKKVPELDAFLNGKAELKELKEVEIEDLLERPSVTIDMDKISRYVRDKVVLISGGGGSIGSELCRQIAGFKPKTLVVVERSENSLYRLKRELGHRFPELHLAASISTVNYRQGLEQLMKQRRVDVVFHAAAYKHVPLMEEVPVEAAYNNILGTYNIAQSALAAGVKRFVMISTDKAVNPTNVMGVSKRIAEMIVQCMNRSGRTQFMTVRFGNVLDSDGSVIPIFKHQLKNNQPLTVTHKDIERYFMTIPEAVQLVLQAGCMGSGGEIFVLDMGRPVKILHLAKKLISLSGKTPFEDVDIQFTGLRPGEKMYEELFNEGECHALTKHPRIRSAICGEVDEPFIFSEVETIRRLIREDDANGLIERFKAIVPSYQPIASDNGIGTTREKQVDKDSREGELKPGFESMDTVNVSAK